MQEGGKDDTRQVKIFNQNHLITSRVLRDVLSGNIHRCHIEINNAVAKISQNSIGNGENVGVRNALNTTLPRKEKEKADRQTFPAQSLSCVH